MTEFINCSSEEEAKEVLTKFKENRSDAIFRGEDRKYSTTVPVVERLDEPEMISFLVAVTPNLVGHMWQNRLKSLITSTCGILTVKDEPFGAADLVDGVYDMEPRNIDWGFYGLMQHYGIPTNWLDLTRNPDTALYFASIENDETHGVIFYGTIDDFYNKARIIDVARFASSLRKIFPIEESRPERQDALALRLEGNTDFRSHMHCVQFPKSNNIRRDKKRYFPPDALKVWIMGQVVDYWLDFRTRVKSMGEHDDNELTKHDNRIRTVIQHLKLW